MFDSSPSADVVGYACRVSERHHVELAAYPGCPAPCIGTTLPAPLVCAIFPTNRPDAQYEVHVAEISVGSLVMGCVYAIDSEGRASPCIGSSDPLVLVEPKLPQRVRSAQ